jgi:hypothetical protein
VPKDVRVSVLRREKKDNILAEVFFLVLDNLPDGRRARGADEK